MKTERHPVAPDQLLLRPVNAFAQHWFVLTAGDLSKQHYNAMTISWGAIGVLWNRPVIQVFVRPERYTFSFMEAYPTFTVSLFRPALRPALDILGTKSGRNCNKITESGLTVAPASQVAAPVFDEAELVIEARKCFAQVMRGDAIIDRSVVTENYAGGEIHRIFIGEIVAASATAEFIQL